ncbi:uncharacterized protein LOC109727525 [Ananas comosus]|uniref:Uncharacterized protein LOC109727525 n=1 Tax=Ananas comosus TaxID=4615 RepID=A0A6P5GZJ8_ANACO|nr:uncharacterized protein LOC109727525 [Ananas comosus]
MSFAGVNLDRAFDLHLDSCNLIQYDSCIDQLIEDERVVTKEFSSLDSELIRESLKAIIYMLKKINEINSYLHCLVTVVNQRRQEGKSELDELLSQLKEKGFFEFSDLPSDNAAQENREGSKLHLLIDKAKNAVFPSLPTHYVVQGLLDYSFVFSLNGEHHQLDGVEDCLGSVEGCCEYNAMLLREEFCLNRVYDATIYDTFGDALSVVLLTVRVRARCEDVVVSA